ncbi:MAG: hypothetical protein ACXVEF_32060 [Polyangiales bacterium]
MPASKTPKPPFPPPDQEAGAPKLKPGKRADLDVYEIEVESEPPAVSRRQTLPVPPMMNTQPPSVRPIPAEKVPTRPSGGAIGDTTTVRPPNERRGLERQGTALGLGIPGIPGPAYGGDTDFDPHDEGPDSPLRTTSSFEKDKGGNVVRTISIEPGRDPLDLGLDDVPGPAFDEAPNEALDLVGRQTSESLAPAEPSKRGDPMGELRERYALGDFSGALTIAEALLEDDPQNIDAQRYAESCRDVLKQMYAARLGPLEQVPMVAVPAEQLRWLTLDHRSGFLLSHVDGVSTLEEILDISGMPHLEAMRIIYDLLQQKVIVFQ